MPRNNILNNNFHVRMHEECVPILHFKSNLCEGIKVVIVLHLLVVVFHKQRALVKKCHGDGVPSAFVSRRNSNMCVCVHQKKGHKSLS